MNATVKLEKKHFPVLLNELNSIISPLYSGTFIDCTFGQGGYTNQILKNKNNKVIALDRDKKTTINALNFKNKFKNNFLFKNIKFSKINTLNLENEKLKAVIFDLGYSTNQILDPDKGLSFNSKGKLNMKLGLNEFSAHDTINKLNSKDLEKIFKYFGEENKSKIISKKICQMRMNKMIQTEDLVKIINKIKFNNKSKIHNSTKIFQSLRIFVNNEVSELIYGLINAFNLLPVGGMIVVVSFQSIEDRIVKYFFKNYSEIKNPSRYLPKRSDEITLFDQVKSKPIVPSKKEKKINPPSRSAKLRYAIKINKSGDFTEFIKKFQNLLDIENLSKKL